MSAVRIPLFARDGAIRAYAVIDAADADWVNQWSWRLTNKGYAARSVRIEGRPGSVRLHRALLGLTRGDGMEGDHINRDRLDNRRSNLRALPKGLNAQNTGGWRHSSSQYRGVSWNKKDGKWTAQIRVGTRADSRLMNLGRFHSEIEAAECAQAARLRLMPYAVEPSTPLPVPETTPTLRNSARTKKLA